MKRAPALEPLSRDGKERQLFPLAERVLDLAPLQAPLDSPPAHMP